MQLRIDTLTESTRGLEQQLAELTSTLATRSGGGGTGAGSSNEADLVELEQLRVLVGQLENQIVTLKQPQQSQRRQQSTSAAAADDNAALAEWKSKYAALERAMATATQDAQTQANRAVELEAMCNAERTRRLKLQTKLKEVLVRTGSNSENIANN